MIALATLALLAGAAWIQDRALVKEFEGRLAKVKEKDVAGRFQLGAWAEGKGLTDLAEVQFEKVVELDPKHKQAREKLGFKPEKGEWVETPARVRRQKCRKAVEEGLTLPDRAELDKLAAVDKYHLKSVEFVGWRESWIQALMIMEGNTGLLAGSFKVAVKLQNCDGMEVARASGVNGVGQVLVDVAKMAETMKKNEESELREKQGTFKIAVPPLRLESAIAHELVHCFQGNIATPWVSEGMACYGCQDPFYYHYFNYFKGKVTEIDTCTTDQALHYARGMAFFDYFKATFGDEKTKAFIKLLVEKKKPSEAAEQVSGKKWADLSRDEARWSEKFVAKFVRN